MTRDEITTALMSLRPGAQWFMRGDQIEWADQEQGRPTDAEIAQRIANPVPTVSQIKAEAQRRIIGLTGATDIIGCLTKQLNAQMRAIELTLIKASGGVWTSEQEAEAASLQALSDSIKAIRAKSNELENSLPANFTNDAIWAP